MAAGRAAWHRGRRGGPRGRRLPEPDAGGGARSHRRPHSDTWLAALYVLGVGAWLLVVAAGGRAPRRAARVRRRARGRVVDRVRDRAGLGTPDDAGARRVAVPRAAATGSGRGDRRACLASSAIGRVRDRSRRDRLPVLIGSAVHALGPALVFFVAGAHTPQLSGLAGLRARRRWRSSRSTPPPSWFLNCYRLGRPDAGSSRRRSRFTYLVDLLLFPAGYVIAFVAPGSTVGPAALRAAARAALGAATRPHAPARSRDRARDARSAHRSPEPHAVPRAARRAARGRPVDRGAAHRPRPLQGGQRHARPRARRRAARRGRPAAAPAAPGARSDRPARRRRVRRVHGGRATRRRRCDASTSSSTEIRQPFDIAGLDFDIDASIGVAMADDPVAHRGRPRSARRRRDVHRQGRPRRARALLERPRPLQRRAARARRSAPPRHRRRRARAPLPTAGRSRDGRGRRRRGVAPVELSRVAGWSRPTSSCRSPNAPS